MKIETGKAYFVPAQELEDDFLKRAEEQSFLFMSGRKPTNSIGHSSLQKDLCICTLEGKRLAYGSLRGENNKETIRWEIERPKPKKKLNIGDSVVIVANTNYHGFTTGEVVKIVPSMVSLPIDGYIAKSLESGKQWYVADEDIALTGNSIRPEKPTIIRLGNLKIVFNGDYTIVTDGRFTGKAKRNPADEYDAVVGFKLAVERYEKGKAPRQLTAKEIIDSMGVANWRK